MKLNKKNRSFFCLGQRKRDNLPSLQAQTMCIRSDMAKRKPGKPSRMRRPMALPHLSKHVSVALYGL